MPAATDPLQPAGDRFRRLQVHDEVDLADVDPQLERRRRHQRRQRAGLQGVFHLQPRRLAHAPVVGPDGLQPGRFEQAAVDTGGEHPGVGPDRRPPPRRRNGLQGAGRAQPLHQAPLVQAV
jgi:hypothetical protein